MRGISYATLVSNGYSAPEELGHRLPLRTAPGYPELLVIFCPFSPRASQGIKRYAMRFQVLGLMFASALLMVAADDPKDAVKKEYDKFEGTWKMESFTIDGKPAPIETFADFRMTLKGENFSTVTAQEKTNGTYKVDPSKAPKTIDITFTGGQLDGLTMLGVYELDGDTYTVCLPTGRFNERPKELVSKPGSGLVLEVFKRVKP
jgi:uncharacterized protein (TIGR03067 family)